jgi:hypothetical protein
MRNIPKDWLNRLNHASEISAATEKILREVSGGSGGSGLSGGK